MPNSICSIVRLTWYTHSKRALQVVETIVASVWPSCLAKVLPLLQVHQCIGHVRGLGLFVGIEMVVDHQSQLPGPGTAKWIKEGMKARKVLVSTDGHHNTVIKIKPPMCFDRQNVDTLIQLLSELLQSGVPAAVKEIDRQYNPQDKATRVQNTSWQKPVNGHAVQAVA